MIPQMEDPRNEKKKEKSGRKTVIPNSILEDLSATE